MNSVIEIDKPLKAYAQDLLRTRLIGGEVKSDLRNCISEVAFMHGYGELVGYDDFHRTNGRALNFITEDKEGRKVRVSNRISAPYRVYAKHLDADRYVFCSTSSDLKTCTFHGWLDIDEVFEAPIFWFEDENGKRSDYCHEVDKMFLYAMPETLNLRITCEHKFCTWDYLNNAWACALCEKACYDTETARRVNAGYIPG